MNDQLIFNQLTVEALKRFIKLYNIEGINLKSIKAAELASEIKNRYMENDDFKSQFVSYVRDVEIAGRKEFWLLKIKDGVWQNLTQTLRSKLSGIANETNDIFTPSEIDIPRYFKNTTDGNKLKLKAIRKKVLQEIDPTRSRVEDGVILKAYVPKEIRHVCYYEINLNTGVVLCGVDVWKSLTINEKYDLVQKDLGDIFGNEFLTTLEKINITEKAKALLNQEFVLTKLLETKTSSLKDQSATYEIKSNRITAIKKGLNAGSIQLNQIKTDNIDTDVKDNTVLQLAEKEEIPYTTESGKAVLFYHDSALERFDYVRFEVYSQEARVKFLNDHLLMSDLNNVFSQII